jgi:uncharacterized Zn-finger protein
MARNDGYPTQAGKAPTLPSGDRTEPSDVATVTTPEVACEGAPGEDAHPLVFMTFGTERELVCPYCSRSFRLAEGVAPGPLH